MNFFNDSLKSLKSALEEKINFDDPDENETRKQEAETENLKKLVQHQNDEIELLRKQIFEYQQKQLTDTRSLLEKRRTSSTNQQQNDSWFWEPETSSKDGSSPAEMADLTTIPLDANDHEVIEKLRQQNVDKESKVKSLTAENAILNEKLKHLADENQQLNKSIEELDSQHQVAIEKVLDVKNSLQEKYASACEENEKFKRQIESYRNALDAKDAEKMEITEIARKCEQQIEELSTQNLRLADENLRKINALINSNFKLNEEFVDEAQLAKWMSTIATKQREMNFEISKLIDENKHIKEESSKHTQERDALKAELINYEIECTELLKSNSMLMADIENLRTSGVGKLETILENDDDEEVDSTTPIAKIIDDDLTSIKSKLEATEVERSEYFDQIQSLKNQLAENVSRCKSYQQEIENLENEKCNYLFELNELKSEEERNILQKELKNYKDREIELLSRIEAIEGENAQTSQSKTLEDELAKALNEMERLNVMREQLNQLEGVKSEMSQKLREFEENIQQLTSERDTLAAECDEMRKSNTIHLENLQKSNELVQELQKKLLEASIDEMNDEKTELQVSYEKALDDIQKLNASNGEMGRAFEELKAHNESLNKKKEEKLKNLELSVNTLEEEKQQLHQAFEELKARTSNFEAFNQEREEKLKNLEISITSLNNEKLQLIEELKAQSSSFKASSDEKDEKLKILELSINALEEEKQQLQQAFEELKALSTNFEAFNQEKEEKLKNLETSITTLTNEKQQLHEAYNSTLAELQSSKIEIESLQQKLLSSSLNDELTLKISTLEQSLDTLTKEKEELSKNFNETQENLQKSLQQLEELQSQVKSIDDLKAQIATLEASLSSLNQEKEGLIALVTTKHNENVQYHNEILRLNQLLQQEANKSNNEEALNDQIKFLREKCDLLAQNLLQEQNNYRLLQQEKNDVVESNNTLNKDIERLRQHLLEVADAYTFEQVSLQKQVEEYKEKLMAVESDAKQSATAYTSASIRANQQAETLQAQYNLLAQQKDELLAKLSHAEDRDNKNQAALTNLQIALEIFQRDKENDIDLKTTSLQKELESERSHQRKLQNDISLLQSQLQEAKNGLMAAARLSDQLELNQLTIDKLNNEIASYQSTIQSLKKQLEDSNANTSNADIALIKNLILGYITAPNANAKTQILKLIANVLNLTEGECTRIGLNSGGGGLSGWFSRGGSDNVNNNVSLTEAFVAFLEKESQPRAQNPNLLTIHENETTTTRKISTDSSSSGNVNTSSSETPAPIMLNDNSLLTPYNNRNSSSILKDILHDT